MPFMVIYHRSDGSAGHEEADAIDEAAHFVERLRNDESVKQIRLFRTEEISFAFRPYYKVELGLPPRMASAAGIARPEEPMVARHAVPVGGTNGAGGGEGGASGLFRR